MSFDLGSAISGAISGAVAGSSFPVVGTLWGAVAGFVIGGTAGGDAKRSAKNKALDAYNAAQKDRAQMVQSATAAQSIVYGEALVSGPIAYAQSTGTKGEYLHLVVLLAGHEVDSIGEIYLNDQPVGTLDGSGNSTAAPFITTVRASAQEFFTADTITLAHTPVSVDSCTIWVDTGAEGYGQIVPFTVSGSTVSAPGFTGQSKAVVYTWDQPTASLVRIKKHLGSTSQTADTDLISESGGKWTSAHQLRGLAYLYIRLLYDQDVFGSMGIPNVRAVVKGRKVLDTRTSTTAWSDNAALCTADYLRNYMGATSTEVINSEVSAAADICDQSVALDGVGTTQKRYTVNGVLTTEAPPKDNLDTLTEAMAGTAPYVQGRFLVRAGSMLSSSLTITEDMLADAALDIQADTSRVDLFNRVTPKYQEPAKTYATVEATPVTNATYVSDDGGIDLPLDVTYAMCNNAMRAQRLAKIALERIRQGLRVTLKCNLQAYDAAPSDVVSCQFSLLGWAPKVFEVESRSIDIMSRQVTLQLRETASGVWDWNYGEATAVDLTPNTALTSPFTRPPALSGLSVATGTTHLTQGLDGTIVTRGLVSWSQSTDIWVVQGGKIQIQSLYANQDPTTQWTDYPPADGAATRAYIGPLQDGRPLLVRARAVSVMGKSSPWLTTLITPVGQSAPPANVSGQSYSLAPGVVKVSWAQPADLDWDYTEWWEGAGYGVGTRIFRGSATTFNWPAPSLGTYSLWGVHFDRTGNMSAAATLLNVTVTSAALQQTANLNPNSVNNPAVVNTSTTVGGSTSFGSSVASSFFVGPTVVIASGDTLKVELAGIHLQNLWYAAALAAVEIWIKVDNGSGQVEVGRRRLFMLPFNAYTQVTKIPIDIDAQLSLAAGTYDLWCWYTVTCLDSAGSATSGLKDFSADCQWRTMRIKR